MSENENLQSVRNEVLRLLAFIDGLRGEPGTPPPEPPPTGNEEVLLDRWVPTEAEPQRTVGPVPIQSGATIVVDVEVGQPHPTEPNGVHVLAWITPDPRQQRDEACYVVLRGKGEQLLVKQAHKVLGEVRGVGQRPVRIATRIWYDGGVLVKVYVGGDKALTVAGALVDPSKPLHVWLSSRNPGQTPGPEVPSIGWAHSCRVTRG